MYSLLFVFTVVAFPLDEAGLKWVWLWLGCGFLLLLVQLFVCLVDDGFYRIPQAFCFWKALLSLTNLARVSMPFFVPRIVVSLWSGAPSSIKCTCSLWISNLNSM